MDDKKYIDNLTKNNLHDIGGVNNIYDFNGVGFLDVLSCVNFNDTSLIDTLRLVGDKISSSILSSNDHFTIESFIFVTFVGLVGAFSAYLFNRFHWKEVSKKEFKSNIGDILINSIQELECSAVEYWTYDYSALTKQKNHHLEINIKTNLRLVRKYIKELENVVLNKSSKEYLTKLQEFEDDIYDLITGGDFESKNRLASKADAVKISRRCSSERAQIFIATH